MILKPHEILQHLGFDIGEEGVEINSNDAYLQVRSLELLGETLNLDNIKDEDLAGLYSSLSFLANYVDGDPVRKKSPLKLRYLLKLDLIMIFKLNVK